MAVSYNKLWKLLVDKKMSKADLRRAADLAPNTMTKLRRDEPVAMSVLEKICGAINADFGDIVEYVPDAEGKMRRKTVKTEKSEVVKIPARLADANKAAELLGKRYSLFTDKMEVTGAVPIVITGEDELED